MKSKKSGEDESSRLYDEHLRLEAEGRYRESREKLEECAKTGAVYALHALAYEIYNDKEPEIERALILYQQAVSKGDEVSAWNIARHFELSKQHEQYIYWLTKSSSMGMDEASSELNDLYPYLVRNALESSAKGDNNSAIDDLEFAQSHGSEAATRALEQLGCRLISGNPDAC